MYIYIYIYIYCYLQLFTCIIKGRNSYLSYSNISETINDTNKIYFLNNNVRRSSYIKMVNLANASRVILPIINQLDIR